MGFKLTLGEKNWRKFNRQLKTASRNLLNYRNPRKAKRAVKWFKKYGY